jgi:hypothetical protein
VTVKVAVPAASLTVTSLMEKEGRSSSREEEELLGELDVIVPSYLEPEPSSTIDVSTVVVIDVFEV